MLDLMIVPLAISNLGLGSCLFLRKAKICSPFQFFYLFLCAAFLGPAVFDTAGQTIHWHPQAVPLQITHTGLLCAHAIIFFVLLQFLLAEIIFGQKKAIQRNQESDYLGAFAYAPIAVCCVLGFAVAAFGARLSALNFQSAREGAVGPLNLLAAYSAVYCVPLCSQWLKPGSLGRCFLAIFAVCLPIVLFAGARQMLLAAVALVALNGASRIRIGPLGQLTLAVFCFPLGEYVGHTIKQLRNLPDLNSRLSFLCDGSWADAAQSIGFGESGLRFAFYQLCEGAAVQDSHMLLYLRRLFLAWLPSFLDVFQIKPRDFEGSLFEALMGLSGGSMHPTFFGTTFADAGFLITLWVLTIFLLMRSGEQILLCAGRYQQYVWGFSVYVSIMWARGAIYGITVVALPVYLLAFLSRPPQSNLHSTALNHPPLFAIMGPQSHPATEGPRR